MQCQLIPPLVWYVPFTLCMNIRPNNTFIEHICYRRRSKHSRAHSPFAMSDQQKIIGSTNIDSHLPRPATRSDLSKPYSPLRNFLRHLQPRCSQFRHRLGMLPDASVRPLMFAAAVGQEITGIEAPVSTPVDGTLDIRGNG